MLVTAMAYYSVILFYYRSTIGHSIQESMSISRSFIDYPNAEEAIATMPADLQELFLAMRSQQEKTRTWIDRLNQDRWLITLGLMLTLGPLFYGVSSLLSRFLTRPIWLLTKATQHIANGDFTVRTEPNKMYWDGYSLTLAQNFNVMASSLERFEDERKTMFADVAHELRTPITSMRLQLEAVKDGINPLDSELVDQLFEETNLLSQIVVDLRTLSLAEADKISLEKSSFNLYDFAKRTLTRFQLGADKKEINLSMEGSEDIYLTADEKHLNQILNNLISNAIKYSPKGADVILAFDSDDNGINISVMNTGQSLSQEDLDSLFNRFYRSGQGDIEAEGGSGLGLAIVKALVERHNGTIKAENIDKGGLVFKLFLPQEVT